MPRFFVAGDVPEGPRDRSRKFALATWTVLAPFPRLEWDVAPEAVNDFVKQAQADGLKPLHNPIFTTPAPECSGSQIFGRDLQTRLAGRHTLDGRGALVVIVDGGVNLARATSAGLKFDSARIKGPAPSAGYRVHGTMCALDAFMGAPNATFGDLSVTDTRDATASSVLQAFRGLSEAANSFEDYKACIVSVSLQISAQSAIDDALVVPESTRLVGNPEHDLWKLTGELPDKGFDIVMAAGNDGCGTGDRQIKGLARHPAVVTVGCVDSSDTIEPHSSHGVAAKPDLAAYSGFLWSDPDVFDAGTSAATALAAGLIASFRVWKDYRRLKVGTPELLNHIRGHMGANGTAQPVHSDRYGWGIL